MTLRGRGRNRENIFINVNIGKKIFSTTSTTILIKLDMNHRWVKDIKDCTNKCPGPLQRIDNHKNANI
jgi:hypothetical protein